jgi:hypothetical protein
MDSLPHVSLICGNQVRHAASQRQEPFEIAANVDWGYYYTLPLVAKELTGEAHPHWFMEIHLSQETAWYQQRKQRTE